MKVSQVTQRSWPSFYISLTLLTLSFIALYFNVIAKLIVDWMKNDNYSHGFLIPLISGYLIWHKREEISGIAIQPSNTGLLILAGGLASFLVANIGAEQFTMRFSMLIVLLGLAIFLGGMVLGKALALPIAYLIFMIPLPAIIWNKIAFPLQLFASKLTATVIYLIGIPILREGNMLQLPNMSLEVVDACSGLRSLTSLLALSAAFALITDHRRPGKLVLFASAAPIAIALNIVRLTSAAVLSELYGPKVTDGFLHTFSGILVFLLALLLLHSVHIALQKTNVFQKSEGNERRPDGGRL